MANNLVRTLSKFSLGFVLILVWGYMYIQAGNFFPVNTEIWRDRLQTLIIFTAFIFAFNSLSASKTERPLFEVSFIKRFPLFLLWAGITGFVLYLFSFLIKGESLRTVSEALSPLGIGVILFFAFFVAIFEELVFRGFVVNELKSRGFNLTYIYIISSVIFALYHYVWSSSITTIIIYIPLGIIWLYIRDKYSPQTNMANAGSHFAYDLFVLGFLT